MLAVNHDEMGRKLVAPMGCAPMSVRLKVCDNNYYTTRHQLFQWNSLMRTNGIYPSAIQIVKTPDSRPLIHRPQRETRPDNRSLSLSHAHHWASSFIFSCQSSISFRQPWFINHLWSRQRTQYIKSHRACKGGFIKNFWDDPFSS